MTAPQIVCVAVLTLATPSLAGETGLSEIAPSLAVASAELTAKIKDHLWKTADGAWVPTREQAFAALSLLRSERGKRALMEQSMNTRMEHSVQRLDKSRYQVFGITLEGRRHLLVDATPLNSDAPELWLTDCISCSVFDGGAAYWWVLMSVEPMEIIKCGRRP